MAISNVKDAYLLVEKARLKLYQEITVDDEFGDAEELGIAPLALWGENNVLRIMIPDYPPRISARDPLQRNFRNQWISYVVKAVRDVDVTVEFDRAFCLVVFYLPVSQPWDPDNRSIKYLLDGLRYARVIKDDSWDHLAYGVLGQVDQKNPRTEIYVTDLVSASDLWARTISMEDGPSTL